jgi:Na+-translocating ferredoxin:NAD+ oxidoreductase RnfD subunit
MSLKAFRQFFRTPKGLLTIVLVILAALAAPTEGIALLAPGFLGAVIVAALVDLPLLRYTKGEWEYPSGAVLTGMIIAMVMSPMEPWYVFAASSAIAVVSKYVLRGRNANIFNPAALALVASYYIFHTGQSWWGALPDLSSLYLLALFATGIFIVDRVNKVPLALVFLGAYFIFFTAISYFGDPGLVADIFRAPDLHAVLFFAFIILTDPPTSPVKYKGQIIFGLIVAVVSFGIFELNGAVYYLLAGVLVGNVWEAWQRWRVASRRRVSASATPEADAPA